MTLLPNACIQPLPQKATMKRHISERLNLEKLQVIVKCTHPSRHFYGDMAVSVHCFGCYQNPKLVGEISNALFGVLFSLIICSNHIRRNDRTSGRNWPKLSVIKKISFLYITCMKLKIKYFNQVNNFS